MNLYLFKRTTTSERTNLHLNTVKRYFSVPKYFSAAPDLVPIISYRMASLSNSSFHL